MTFLIGGHCPWLLLNEIFGVPPPWGIPTNHRLLQSLPGDPDISKPSIQHNHPGFLLPGSAAAPAAPSAKKILTHRKRNPLWRFGSST